MSQNTKISPSLMCMDIAKFSEQITFMNTVVDFYHIDIMDGHYVPNITLSNMFVQQLQKYTSVPIEVHYMVNNPVMFADEVIGFGASTISIHPEALQAGMFRFIDNVKSQNVNIGIVLNPDTSINIMKHYIHLVDKVTVMTVDPGFAGQKFIPEMLDKVKILKEMKSKKSYNYTIEIDGGCNPKTFKSLIESGAESLVVGTSGLFNNDESIVKSWSILEENIRKAEYELIHRN